MRIARKILLVLIAVVALPIIWFSYRSFATGFSAKAEPNPLEIMLARNLRRLAIPAAQREMANPIPATPAELVRAREHFADHCATCHGNDGSGDTVIGRNVYPKAPDLRKQETQSLTDGELFFIIHNGIRFTAMPAWGSGPPEQDRDSWRLVHFIRHLPKLTGQEQEEMRRLNPMTPSERTREEEFQKFLRGESAEPPAPAEHHH